MVWQNPAHNWLGKEAVSYSTEKTIVFLQSLSRWSKRSLLCTSVPVELKQSTYICTARVLELWKGLIYCMKIVSNIKGTVRPD